MRRAVIHSVIPPLQPPAGARQFPEGGGGSPDRMRSDARLPTDRDLATVAEHYRGQLAAEGWEQQNSGQHDLLAWSSWSFQDRAGQTWRGLFFAFHRPDLAGEYFISVRAEWMEAGLEQARGGLT